MTVSSTFAKEKTNHVSMDGLKPLEASKDELQELATNDKKTVETSRKTTVDSWKELTMANVFHKTAAWVLMLYTLYSLFGMIAWVSHLGARVEWLQPFLLSNGFAGNKPVKNIYELFKYNAATALLFTLSHSLLRPPRMMKLVGFRYARLVYCAMSGLTCHLLIAFFRPINMSTLYQACFESPPPSLEEASCDDYVYDETANIPLFTLPVPKYIHDWLSISMLVFSMYALMIDYRTYIILGFNRVYYGPNSGYDKFPRELSPRMDIITWIGYTVWLKAGSLGFVLFSGLSILPYKVYTWDLVMRVVAAIYLRARSQGFRIWVGKIESTHHFIWVLRGVILVIALWYQYTLLKRSQQGSGSEVGAEDGTTSPNDVFTVKSVALMIVSAIATVVIMHRLEKLK